MPGPAAFRARTETRKFTHSPPFLSALTKNAGDSLEPPPWHSMTKSIEPPSNSGRAPTLILPDRLSSLLPILGPYLRQIVFFLRVLRSRTQHFLLRVPTRLKLATKMHVAAFQNFTHVKSPYRKNR